MPDNTPEQIYEQNKVAIKDLQQATDCAKKCALEYVKQYNAFSEVLSLAIIEAVRPNLSLIRSATGAAAVVSSTARFLSERLKLAAEICRSAHANLKERLDLDGAISLDDLKKLSREFQKEDIKVEAKVETKPRKHKKSEIN